MKNDYRKDILFELRRFGGAWTSAPFLFSYISNIRSIDNENMDQFTLDYHESMDSLLEEGLIVRRGTPTSITDYKIATLKERIRAKRLDKPV